MTTDELKVKAVELASIVRPANAGELLAAAEAIYAFLDGASSKSESTTTKKPSRTKAASASQAEALATSSSTSVVLTSEAPQVAAEQAVQAAKQSAESGTSQASKEPTSQRIPTLDEVRKALTECQTRHSGDASKPREQLLKFAPTGTLGSLKEEDRQKVIDACAKV